MAEKKDILEVPKTETICKLQEEMPDVISMPITTKELLNELNSKEKRYPILKETPESLRLLGLLNKLDRARANLINELDYIPLVAAIQHWLVSLSTKPVQIKYASYMTDLIKRKAVPVTFADGKDFTVGALRHVNRQSIIKYIEQMDDLSNSAKYARIECYISFTAFLQRITSGSLRKALPSNSKKYLKHQSSIKMMSKALTAEEWFRFSRFLAASNYRDYLIAITMFIAAVRVSDVLSLGIDQIDFKKRIIRFPYKKQNMIHEVPVVYPAAFMRQLKEYVNSSQGERAKSGYIFVTRSGKQLTRSRVNQSFSRVSRKAKMRQVSPDMIRATWLALKQKKMNEEVILNIFKPKEATCAM